MLTGRSVRLSPLRNSDAKILFEWINDRDEVLHNAGYKPVHEAQHRKWLESLQNRSDLAIFGITHVDGTLIGTCQLHSISPIHQSAELQIRIGDVRYRGKGYGAESVSLLLQFGFRDLNLHRIYLQVFSSNAAALSTYAKAGFCREGVLREAVVIDGRREDVVVMGILRREYDDRS